MARSTFTYKSTSLASVLKQANKWAKDKVDAGEKELDVAAQNVASEARAHAKGSVAASIYTDTGKRFNKVVGSASPVAAYDEFGTGVNVFQGSYSFTPEEKVFAKQFYVSGKGRTKSHAFLFPAFHNEIPKLLGRIKRALFG